MRPTATFDYRFSERALKHKELQPLKSEQRSPLGIAVTLFHICGMWDLFSKDTDSCLSVS